MTAPGGTAARIAALEARTAEQAEQLRALSDLVNGLTDAFVIAFRYAGVDYPRPPRRLRAVPDSPDGAR